MGLLAWLGMSEGSLTLLGEGISGKVELYESGKTCYVIKTYHSIEKHESRKEYHDRVLHEYHLLASLDHRNFLQVIKSEVSFNGLRIRIYMEPGTQDLRKLMRKHGQSLDSADLLCLWKQICEGIHYLHGRNLCHRDLKLENIVMDRDFKTVKIIDLMTATECNAPVMGIVGSSRYMAPEMASKISYEGKNVDIWSLGIILYYFITLEFPWKQAVHLDPVFKRYTNKQRPITEMNIANKIQYSLTENDPHRYPSSVLNLISNMLNVDPDDRYDVDQIFADKLFNSITTSAVAKQFFQNELSEIK